MTLNSFLKNYKQVVVIDTEYTTWEGSFKRGWSDPQEHREIFQVSALKVDLVKDEIVDVFDRFVKPRINPVLSEYAVKLTSVTQAKVDRGVDFEVMYLDLMVWTNGLPICSYARSSGKEGEGEVFKENIKLYELDVPYTAERYINLVSFFIEAGVSVQKFSSGQLYKCFNVELPGHVHEANHDVNSLAISLIALKEESSVMS